MSRRRRFNAAPYLAWVWKLRTRDRHRRPWYVDLTEALRRGLDR